MITLLCILVGILIVVMVCQGFVLRNASSTADHLQEAWSVFQYTVNRDIMSLQHRMRSVELFYCPEDEVEPANDGSGEEDEQHYSAVPGTTIEELVARDRENPLPQP